MTLRKIINDPHDFVDEVLDGIVRAHPDSYQFASRDRRAVIAPATPDKVGIVTGGGSGHLPLFLGYVGQGLATGVAVGNVFSSPSPAQILATTRAADSGRGVLYLYGNYGGDVYNFDLAAEQASLEGIPTRTVLGADDVFSAPADKARTRRGIAGLVMVYKVAGAAAARGDDLDDVAAIAQRAADAVRTAGVGLAPTILPAAGRPTFVLGDGEMEIGVGIHGERGIDTVQIPTAASIANTLFGSINAELQLDGDSRVAVLINGLGATPLEELYVLYSEVARLVEAQGTHIAYNFVGEYATSLEMAGASVSIMKLDSELEDLLNEPARSPFYRPGTSIPEPVSRAETAQDELSDDAVPTADFPSALRGALIALAEELPTHEDELRDLDAALGDGDLGLTVSAGVAAIAQRLNDLPENTASSVLLRESAVAFASANPSTFAALLGSGMLAASAVVDDTSQVTVATAVAIGRAIAEAIAQKGGAKLGDKTLLDVLVPALDEIERGTSSGELAAFLTRRVDEVADLRSARGRAAWHQERSIGLKDPGSVAAAYAIEALSRYSGA
ncbi:dihydroxyacetone kinase family protein [Microbacterium sp. KR10-403]|uniref:dihydroxyacetone kinase family protein n=1 Tax=Microbacterium sp. KR10-403 TaxID=3158581 RepID=UPI0032E3920B